MKFRVVLACQNNSKAVLYVNAACMQHAIANAMNSAVVYGFQPSHAVKAELKMSLLGERE